jgi:hypothetical protein
MRLRVGCGGDVDDFPIQPDQKTDAARHVSGRKANTEGIGDSSIRVCEERKIEMVTTGQHKCRRKYQVWQLPAFFVTGWCCIRNKCVLLSNFL